MNYEFKRYKCIKTPNVGRNSIPLHKILLHKILVSRKAASNEWNGYKCCSRAALCPTLEQHLSRAISKSLLAEAFSAITLMQHLRSRHEIRRCDLLGANPHQNSNYVISSFVQNECAVAFSLKVQVLELQLE